LPKQLGLGCERKIKPKSKEQAVTNVTKVSEHQAYVPELFTAEALLEYRRDLRECYGEEVWRSSYGAVGPQQTFIGWLVKTGRITINE
jgi:hypothetical protein